MCGLIERARALGVRRFALLSSSAIPEGTPGIGRVELFLRERTPEWAVLKPSWFMQNFLDPEHFHGRTIRDERAIYTSTGQGRVSFVDAADIGEVGARVLLAEPAPNAPLVITGPETLSYDDIASMMGVRHIAIDDTQSHAHLVRSGLASEYAAMLVHLDGLIREGAEDRITATVERITGHAPRAFRDLLAGR